MINALIMTVLVKRDSDSWGSGHFHAPRDGGKRLHNGIDFLCPPGCEVLSPIDGEVTKLGFPYAEDLSYRYVQVTDRNGGKHRCFYIEPTVREGQHVKKNDMIGISQDLSKRYNTPEKGPIPNHVHYEIMVGDNHEDPELYNTSSLLDKQAD